MMSYSVNGFLCDSADHAAQIAINEWIWGINSAEDVAAFNAKEIFQETMVENPIIEAQVVGRMTEDGERVYEDVTPTPERRREIIEEVIADAKAAVAAEGE